MSAPDNYIGRAIQGSALAALRTRLERRIHEARRERDSVDRACRMAAGLAVFEPEVWHQRYEDAWQRGKSLDEKIEALEIELDHVERQIAREHPLLAA